MFERKRLQRILTANVHTLDKAEALIEKIDDNDLLVTIVRNSEWPRLRLRAFQKVKDRLNQRDILELSIHSDCEDLFVAAAEELKDEDVLADFLKVAKFDEHNVKGEFLKEGTGSKVCRSALEKIKNPALLGDIALYAHSVTATEKASAKISDQSVLLKFLASPKPILRWAALRQLTLGDDRLFDLAMHDSDQSARTLAACKIKNPAILSDLFDQCKDIRVLLSVIRDRTEMMREFNQERLAQIVLDAEDKWIGYAMIGEKHLIYRPDLLAEIARRTNDELLRKYSNKWQEHFKKYLYD